jgi:hypothetical protein
MELRELLQKEIWSKRTSRKIWLVVKRTFRVVEVALVGFVIVYLANSTWLTSPERKAGRVALGKIDALQSFSGMSEEEYVASHKQAEEMVHGAEQAAWTGRDEFIASSLSAYLEFTDIRRQEQKFRDKLSTSKDENLRNRSLQVSPSSIAASEFESGSLHQALR